MISGYSRFLKKIDLDLRFIIIYKHQIKNENKMEMDNLIISVTGQLQQLGFEKGKHDRPWSKKAEKEYRRFLKLVPVDKRNALYETLVEDLENLKKE
jgi:hypothetical protein